MRFIYCFILWCFCYTAAVHAQPSARAQKLLRKGQSHKAKKDTLQAYRCIEKAFQESPAYDDAYSTMGQWLYEAKSYRRAAGLFATAAVHCHKGREHFSLPAGRSYLMAMQIDSALYWLNAAPASLPAVKQLKEQARRLQDVLSHQDTNKVIALGPRINTSVPELFPSIAADGQTLYFTRRINGRNEDFYFARPDSCGGWLTACNMGYPPNTAAQESAMTISADNHYLFFMRSDNRSDNGWGRGGCDLYLAYRVAADSPWSVPESFGATINTPAFEGMPSLSPDITDIYFSSNRPGGYGGLDIWVSRFEYGLWQLPKNLGPAVNTAGNEISPFISSDNRSLYFSSDGHPGLGGSDLYLSRKTGDSVFSVAINLGYPINSTFDENGLYIAPDGHYALLASDRNNSSGNLDIYETTLPEAIAPLPTAFVLCYIYDSISKEVAQYGSITLSDAAGKTIAVYQGNRGDGSVLMSLPLNTIFNYEVKAFSYQSFTGSLYYTEVCPDACTLQLPLLKQGYIKPTTDSPLLTVCYPKNVTDLPDSTIAKLRGILGDWKTIPDITIFVNGYTDNTGTPMINLQKSTIRANVLAQFLKEEGFPADRIQATGFGEANPVAPNDSPGNQDKNRRAELIIRY